MKPEGEVIKENIIPRPPLSTWWLVAALAWTLLLLGVVSLVDLALPEPLPKDSPHRERFIGAIAYEHLVNLTSIGPRVAGSYENEVLAVGVLVEAVKKIAAEANHHHRVEVDVQTVSGAFALDFFDGMTNIYRNVQNVVVRVSAVGGRERGRRAVLINCHFDTVPDSPGASDDGAGCAVALETLRALVATPHPLRHDVVVLLNGAEENILQASHGFVTRHPWAKSVRAFINIEACGAGGREVLFQAGPHDPWIMEVYAGAVPHPFASSLAQELFDSGVIPADTDFRIFRDFGNLSGVDLAWSANGYVYHTRLDEWPRVPPAALQRTGDNVLALAHGLAASERLESAVEAESRQPVYFDVGGLAVVCVRPSVAALLALLAALLVLLHVARGAAAAAERLYVERRLWWRAVWSAALCGAGAALGGVLLAGAGGALLHLSGARLTYYCRGWLLAPLYAIPAVCASWWTALRAWRRCGAERWARGGWALRCWGAGGCLAWGAALLACTALRLRSGFLPLLWALPPAALALLSAPPRPHTHTRTAWDRAPLAWWALCTPPVLQSWYLVLNALRMFVPLAGRAGTPPLPADVLMGAVVAAQVLLACNWMLPLVIVTRNPHRLIYGGLAASAVCYLAVMSGGWVPYSADHPQRMMVLHTRRTVHPVGGGGGGGEPHTEALYWVPHLDANTARTVRQYVGGEVVGVGEGQGDQCARWPYCGAPYFLPVLRFVGSGSAVPAPEPPALELTTGLRAERLDERTMRLHLYLEGPQHAVVMVTPAAGARLVHCAELGGAPPPGAPLSSAPGRPSHFIALHDARPRHPDRRARFNLTLLIERSTPTPTPTPTGEWALVSAAGHSMAGARHPLHRRLLAALPAWTAPTGWGVDLHLHTV